MAVRRRKKGSKPLGEIRLRYSPPGPGRALLRVQRAGVASGDLFWAGLPLLSLLRRVPGYDLCGEIVSVGPGAGKQFRPGQRVCALSMNGAYARYIKLPFSRLLTVPENLDDGAACALVLNYLSAWQMISRIRSLQGYRQLREQTNRPVILLHS